MELQNVSISKCEESATNPRGAKLEGKEFDELVASVKEKGVLMPILVRPQGATFEVVAGAGLK
jgi:ParB family chromosome partitioning protein